MAGPRTPVGHETAPRRSRRWWHRRTRGRLAARPARRHRCRGVRAAEPRVADHRPGRRAADARAIAAADGPHDGDTAGDRGAASQARRLVRTAPRGQSARRRRAGDGCGTRRAGRTRRGVRRARDLVVARGRARTRAVAPRGRRAACGADARGRLRRSPPPGHGFRARRGRGWRPFADVDPGDRAPARRRARGGRCNGDRRHRSGPRGRRGGAVGRTVGLAGGLAPADGARAQPLLDHRTAGRGDGGAAVRDPARRPRVRPTGGRRGAVRPARSPLGEPGSARTARGHGPAALSRGSRRLAGARRPRPGAAALLPGIVRRGHRALRGRHVRLHGRRAVRARRAAGHRGLSSSPPAAAAPESRCAAEWGRRSPTWSSTAGRVSTSRRSAPTGSAPSMRLPPRGSNAAPARGRRRPPVETRPPLALRQGRRRDGIGEIHFGCPRHLADAIGGSP